MNGNGKLLGRLGLLLVVLALAACVKRAPRPDQTTPASPPPPKKCGMACRLAQRLSGDDEAAPARPATPGNPRTGPGAHRGPGEPAPGAEELREESRHRGQGVYHTVKKGETFWRICHTYEVEMATVAAQNGITDPTAIKVGQRIWIPGAQATVAVGSAPLGGPDAPVRNGDRDADQTPALPHPSPTRGALIFPVPGGRVTSGFGPRGDHPHEGVDIVAPSGTPVLAADDGKVVYSGDGVRGYGNLIIIKHVGDVYTAYAHNRRNLVKVGDLVQRGQQIAEVGDTGRATACHCHFEVRVGEKPVNPELYLP